MPWYGSLLIIGTLFVATGWELFRWILAIIAWTKSRNLPTRLSAQALIRIKSGIKRGYPK